MNKEEIWIGNDHGGYRMKLSIVEFLKKNNILYRDIGTYSEDIVRYPYFARKVAQAISEGNIKRGILICSTGIGMSIIANKYKGVRASLCNSRFTGEMTRAHNDSNLLVLGGKTTGEFEAIEILQAWLNTEFEGGRHSISLDLINEAEQSLCTEKVWEPKRLNL